MRRVGVVSPTVLQSFPRLDLAIRVQPMTVPPNVAALAFLALHDDDAIPVLGDAVLEAGWYDDRVMELWDLGYLSPYTPSYAHEIRRRRLFDRCTTGQHVIRSKLRRWVWAIAAVAIFGEWSTSRWPISHPAIAHSQDILKQLYPQMQARAFAVVSAITSHEPVPRCHAEPGDALDAGPHRHVGVSSATKASARVGRARQRARGAVPCQA